VTEPVPTRREPTASDVPVGPNVTRREEVAAGPPPTRHEGAIAADWSVLAPNTLPPALATRLTDLTAMEKGGGEAQLVRVRDTDHPHEPRVLKVYYPHIQPDPTVWAQLSSIRSKHVVTVVETGTLADGRFFELMEYVPDGSLRDAGAGSQVFDTAHIREIVRQLATGLAALHGSGITHRDLKPDNVLVRAAGPTGEMVLTDFGLSRRLNSSAHFTTGARTSAYAAPEAWAGHVSPARDWWSLGIMVLELATGQLPFDGLDERMIQMAVTTKPVPVDAITDARLNRLCAGLLVSDKAKRWGLAEVRDWLAGGSPAVPDRRVPVDATEFEFDGQRFRDPEALATAMARNWLLAANRFGISPSPPWNALVTWLHQFDNPDHYPAGVVEERLDLLGRLEQSKEKPNSKLLRLLAGLNPKQPPVFRQAHIDVPRLRDLARRAQDGPENDDSTKRAREIVNELCEGELLEVLARFDGAAQLGQVGKRWSVAITGLRDAVGALKHQPHLKSVFATKRPRAIARAAMLELVLEPARGDEWIRELAERGRALPKQVPWYDQLIRWVGADPVRAYVGLVASGAAQAEAQQAAMAEQAAWLAQQAREQAWANHEQQRLAGKGSATGRALAGGLTLTALWLLVAVFAAKTPALSVVLLPIATHLTAELVLANEMGTDYHPGYSLWQAFQLALGRIGGRMRGSPRGWAIGIVVTLVLLGFVSWLVPLAALAATATHIVWAVRRHGRWQAEHNQARWQVLNQ
jgi:eukaryotic-like serine/threonine-protein kinase